MWKKYKRSKYWWIIGVVVLLLLQVVLVAGTTATPGQASASTQGAVSSCASEGIALLGDSLTNNGWGLNFRQKCGNQPVNFAEDGINTEMMLNILNTQILTQPFDTLIVLGGTNDINNGKSADEVVANLEVIYESARNKGMRVIAGTIPPFNKAGEQSKNDVVMNVNEWIGSQEGDSVDQVVDFYTLLVGAEPCMNPTYGDQCNNVHPNANGYQAMSNKVLNEVFGGAVSVGGGQEEEEPEAEYGEEPVSGAQEGGAVGGQTIPQNLPQRWKEIDDVWIKISLYVGGEGANKIWDSSLGAWGWRNFNDVYVPVTPTTGAPVAPGAKQKVKLTVQQKEWVKKYATAEGVEPQLALAIINAESTGDSNAISWSGCSGLMQLCGSSASSSVITVQCKQNRNLGPQKCDLNTCQSQTGGWIWCKTCVGGNNCAADERFDAEKNIWAGIKVVKSKQQLVQGCKAGADLVKCQISAYNIGHAVVNAAVAKVGGTPAWEQVYAQYDIQLLRDHGYSKYSDTEIKNKINQTPGYVNKIYTGYVQGIQ